MNAISILNNTLCALKLYVFTLVLAFSISPSQAQTAIATTHTFTLTGSLVTFNVQNTNTVPIGIKSLDCYLATTGNHNWTILYNTTAVNSNGNIWTQGQVGNGLNGWVVAKTGSTNVTTVQTTTLTAALNIIIPANTTYGIAVSDNSLGLQTLTGGTGVNAFTEGGVSILTGDNISWSSIATVPATPASYPRGFIGGITFANAPCTPSVAITSANLSGCLGDSISFTAIPTYPGAAPSFQWLKNGVAMAGANAISFTSADLQTGDSIQVQLTSNASCATTSVVTSKSLYPMVTTGTITPTISITASPSTSVVIGTVITFTASTTFGGSTPSYEWSKNGNTVGTDSPIYKDSAVLSNDVITCTLSSSATCASPSIVTSAGLTISTYANYCSPIATSGCSSDYIAKVVMGNINRSSFCDGTKGYIFINDTANATKLTQGSNYSISVTPSNSSPEGAVAWIDFNQNGLFDTTETLFAKFTNVKGFTYTTNFVVPKNATPGYTRLRVRCLYGFKTPGNNTACNDYSLGETEDYLIKLLESPCTASVSIASNLGTTICKGVTVTFKATPINGGKKPIYQWYKNAVAITGATDSIYKTSVLSSGDNISCSLTSNAGCAVANPTAQSNTLTINFNSTTYTPITINCPTDINVFSAPNECGKLVNYNPAVVTGTPTPSVSYTIPTGSYFNVGINPITITASNSCETQNCSFKVIINDTSKPYFTTFLSDVTLYADNTTGCGAPYSFVQPNASDNCTPALISGTKTFNYTGTIETFTVPAGCNRLTIAAYGAEGGNAAFSTYPAGLGAYMQGDFRVAGGDKLKVLVGKHPIQTIGGVTFADNSGGGGSFVTYTNNVPLIIAGGGGGSGNQDTSAKNGNITTVGGTGVCCGTPGSNGNGAIGGSGAYGSGGGMLTGASGGQYGTGYGGNGDSYLNGGLGSGVFGCAGKGSGTTTGGGGGGYSGGCAGASGSVGGGGASYNAGYNQANIGAAQSGDGMVTIDYTNNNLVIKQTAGLPSNSTFPIGTTTNTFTATDSSGNFTTTSFNVIVLDTTRPTITCPPNTSATVTTSCFASGIALSSAQGTDNCFIKSVYNNAPDSFPVGVTTVTWTVADSSGNTNSCPQLVTVINNIGTAKITIAANPGTTVNAGATVTFTATATNGGTAPSYQWTKNGVNISGATASTFTTSNLANGDAIACILTSSLTCLATPTVTSNTLTLNIGGQVVITGNVRHANGKIIPNVTVKDNGINAQLTDALGNYTFSDAPNTTHTIRASKNNDKTKTNGITVNDVIQVQGYALKKLNFNSPFKTIAADVNSSGDISVIDILYLKRLALGIDTTFPGNKLWAFVDSSYAFPDSTKPFRFRDSITNINLSSNITNPTFIGIKLGDVNWDWNMAILGNQTPTTKPIELYYHNIDASNTAEITIPIKVNQFKNILGMQYTLNYNPMLLQLKSITNASKLNLEYATNHSAQGNLSFLWSDQNFQPQTLPDSTTILNLVFTKLGNINNQSIQLSSSITPVEAWDAQLIQHNIIQTAGKITDDPTHPATPETWTLSPNPTPGKLAIQLQLQESKPIQFQLTNAQGKLLYTKSCPATKGTTTLQLNLTEQAPILPGIYHLKAIGLTGKQVKQVLIR